MIKSELVKIFKDQTLDVSSQYPQEQSEITSKICFTGQPVLISKQEAVLRIALGSDSLRSFIENPEETLKQDIQIIKKMAYLGRMLSSESKL